MTWSCHKECGNLLSGSIVPLAAGFTGGKVIWVAWFEYDFCLTCQLPSVVVFFVVFKWDAACPTCCPWTLSQMGLFHPIQWSYGTIHLACQVCKKPLQKRPEYIAQRSAWNWLACTQSQKKNHLPVVIHSPKPANLSLTGVNRITNRQRENMILYNNNLAAQKFQGWGKVLWP